MAIPSTAQSFTGVLDPHEELDFRIELGDMLETGEAIDDAGWTLEVLAEGTALGLTIMSGGGRDAALVDNDTAVAFWLTIDADYRDNAAFDSLGTALPLRIAAQTSSSPARRRQRTFQVKVAQQ